MITKQTGDLMAQNLNDYMVGLRQEANNVKDCFTKFSFQAIAISGIVLGAMANLQPQQPFVGLAGILVMVIVLTVCKIGNYKYATANRHFGYELFISLMEKGKLLGLPKNYQISWEEALRAWRIIQATIFDELYHTKSNAKIYNLVNRWKYNQIKDNYKKKIKKDMHMKQLWFEPRTLVGGDAKWYPGRYLCTMQEVLNLIAFVSLFPVIIMSFQFQFVSMQSMQSLNFIAFGGMKLLTLVGFSISIFSFIVLLFRVKQTTSRRNLLECGILSIHSCAIMWHIVVLSHKHASEKTYTDQCEYLKLLSDEADVLTNYILNIQDWFTMKTSK